MSDVMHEVRPLSAYLWGNLRLFFRGSGSVAQRIRIDQDSAHRLRVAFENHEPCDSVLTGSFIALELDALDAMEWIADSRQPSRETAVDRLLRRSGNLFREGWLQTINDLAPAGAEYSLAGLVAWKSTALLLVTERPELDDEERREVLRNLCRLWNKVADPGDLTLDDSAARLADQHNGEREGTRPGRRPAGGGAQDPAPERSEPSHEGQQDTPEAHAGADGSPETMDQQSPRAVDGAGGEQSDSMEDE